MEVGVGRKSRLLNISCPTTSWEPVETPKPASNSSGTDSTMCSSLPPELLDLVVDHLHNKPATLKACSLVSQSWVPRARRHIFAHVEFDGLQFTVQRWTEVFPDPSSSPAHYTRFLMIFGVQSVTAAGTDAGRWIRAFHSVVRLRMDSIDRAESWGGDPVSLLPFHGLSPAIRSLHLYFTSIPHSEVLGLMCSFPLLKDFIFVPSGFGSDADKWIVPLTSPRHTGFLKLGGTVGVIRSIARRMFDLPNGLRFTKIVLAGFSNMDFGFMTDLVSGAHSQMYNGSPGRSRASSPKISNESPYGLVHTPLRALFRKQFIRNGGTLTVCWSNSGPRIRFFQRSCMRWIRVRRIREVTQEACYRS